MSAYNKYFSNSTSKPQLQEIIAECRQMSLQIDKVLSEDVAKWYNALSWSGNTRPEFVLLSSIGVTSAILGTNTSLKIRRGSVHQELQYAKPAYAEPSQLYITILSEPGSGKSNAQNLAVEEPLTAQLDPILSSVIVQVSSFVKMAFLKKELIYTTHFLLRKARFDALFCNLFY